MIVKNSFLLTMSPELTKQLFDKYPEIFIDKNKSIRESLVSFGFEYENGWYKITDEYCAKLEVIRKLTGIKSIATQMKEKFGGLRFYSYINYNESKLSKEDTEIFMRIFDDLEYQLERTSLDTCEICGEFGELRVRGGYYRTLCEKDAKKLEFY
jgi:hypothetical protein